MWLHVEVDFIVLPLGQSEMTKNQKTRAPGYCQTKLSPPHVLYHLLVSATHPLFVWFCSHIPFFATQSLGCNSSRNEPDIWNPHCSLSPSVWLNSWTVTPHDPFFSFAVVVLDSLGNLIAEVEKKHCGMSAGKIEEPVFWPKEKSNRQSDNEALCHTNGSVYSRVFGGCCVGNPVING